MRRRKRNHSHANHERWLVSYADFITLLFAFFVVLYASEQVDQRRVGKLALAIQVAFQDMGVFPASTTQIPLNSNEPMPFSTVQAIENATHEGELGDITSSPNGMLEAPSDEADFSTLQTELEHTLEHEISVHTVALHNEADGLVISLREFGFFDSGSPALKPAALPVLDRIAATLVDRPYHLRIEGHTDNVPIHNAQMASNWELSTARATELVRLLIQRYQFAPERLAAAGFAQYHPIAGNDTLQGRAQNRRVDLVILSEHNSGHNPPITQETNGAAATQNSRPTQRFHVTQEGAIDQGLTKPTPAVPLTAPPNN